MNQLYVPPTGVPTAASVTIPESQTTGAFTVKVGSGLIVKLIVNGFPSQLPASVE